MYAAGQFLLLSVWNYNDDCHIKPQQDILCKKHIRISDLLPQPSASTYTKKFA